MQAIQAVDRGRRAFLYFLATTVVSIALMGCTAVGIISASALPATSVPETSVITSEERKAATFSASFEDFPEGVGRDRFIAICSRCHSAKFVVGKRYSTPQWEAVMRQMTRHGAKIPREDQHLILVYLSKNFD